jgi:hypothetical protein
MMRKATRASVIAAASCLALLGTGCINGQKPEPSPAKAEHPKAEHPKGEHPKGEHPKGEHPKGEHPKDDGANH